MQCPQPTSPSPYSLAPSHYPHLGSFIISETHNSLPCAKSLDSLNVVFVSIFSPQWDPETLPLCVCHNPGRGVSSLPPGVSRCIGVLFAPRGLHRHHLNFSSGIFTLPPVKFTWHLRLL